MSMCCSSNATVRLNPQLVFTDEPKVVVFKINSQVYTSLENNEISWRLGCF